MDTSPKPDREHLKRNLEQVLERIARAARRSGRRPEEIRLVAVTKGVLPEAVRLAVEVGVTDLGENRVQEGEAKRTALAPFCPEIRWHMVGHLQTNKARRAAHVFDVIHSIDSARAAEALASAVARPTVPGGPPGADEATEHRPSLLDILVQVNVSGEASKYGLPLESVSGLLRRLAGLDGLRVRGLMTIAPFVHDPEEVRPVFRRLAELANSLDKQRLPGVSMDLLSMGMSQDFEVAVSEGANLVRVGTAIFGPRGG